MENLGHMLLGLGLFFLGMQLVGEYLRRLSGSSFRVVLQKFTHSPVRAGLVGLLFGALMQSATAVVFVVAGMARSGILRPTNALPVVLWSNVGLTALAFVLSFNIHPIVAWIVGLSGIAFGMLKRPLPRAWAGILLGTGLLLFGLHEMSQSAEPLKNTHAFQTAIEWAARAPWLAFLGGIAAAAILQSNTGATLLIITLSAAGAISKEVAIPMIYGTNLGAIFLRLFLAAGLRGDGLRLVRFEDLFVLAGGFLMMVLFYLESLGIPLVRALADTLGHSTALRLAIIFLLSNMIPAVVFGFFASAAWKLLVHWIPDDPVADAARPAFLSNHALENTGTSIDLLRKESARLLGMINIPLGKLATPTEAVLSPFDTLAETIETFEVKISSQFTMSEKEAREIHLLRSGLSMIRHLRDAAEEATKDLSSNEASPPVEDLIGKVSRLFESAKGVLDKPDGGASEQFKKATKEFTEDIKRVRSDCLGQPGDSAQPDLNILDDLEISGWLLHRFSKLLGRLGGGNAQTEQSD